MKESNIDKVFSPSEEETKNVEKILKKTYLSQERIPFNTERLKTTEEIEIIDFLGQETNKIAQEFGGQAAVVQENTVHIISEEEYKDFHQGDPQSVGVLSIRLQGIVLKNTDLNLIRFTNIVAHEMFHLRSYQSMSSNWEKNKNLIQRRIGFGITAREDKNKSFYVDLNEAVTEYMNQRMIRDRWAEDRNILPQALQAMTKDLSKEQFIDKFATSYVKEQLRFMEIMDRIKDKNPDEFKTREDVLKIFGEAYFTGKLLKLRKLIDGVYGKGSFVEFAEKGIPPSEFDKRKEKENK